MNQYIITTHSSVFLDAGRTEAVFRVDHDGDSSTVERCKTTKDAYAVLDSLGARASDILQANVVIWVEGPTDRMFIKRCFELKSYGLVEGIEYQIAFYGGRLRAHLTVGESNEASDESEDSTEDLVNVMRLSRNVVMVCDSDKVKPKEPIDSDEAKPKESIDSTKRRLKEECEAMGGFYWVTDGREIENYFKNAVLARAYEALTGTSDAQIELGQFDKMDEKWKSINPDPPRGKKWASAYARNKAKIMPHILEHLTVEDLDYLDLEQRLSDLAKYIRNANSAASADEPEHTASTAV